MTDTPDDHVLSDSKMILLNKFKLILPQLLLLLWDLCLVKLIFCLNLVDLILVAEGDPLHVHGAVGEVVIPDLVLCPIRVKHFPILDREPHVQIVKTVAGVQHDYD